MNRGRQEESEEISPGLLLSPGAIDPKQDWEIEKNPPRKLLPRQAGMGIKRKEGDKEDQKASTETVFQPSPVKSGPKREKPRRQLQLSKGGADSQPKK